MVQERPGMQAKEANGLLNRLFAEHWELHCAKLRKLAHEAGQEERTSEMLAVNMQQRSVAAPSYRPPTPAGRGRGAPAGPRRLELKKGGFDLSNYPGAKQEPQGCCRGWWLDGICNATAGVSGCKFQHEMEHKGKGWPATT
jgi:hypothetical protein